MNKKGTPRAPLQKRPSEHLEQVCLFQWAQRASCIRPELRLMFAIPNGGARDVVTGAMLKAEGVKAGVPDICLPVARGSWHGLWIEMKARDGALKAHQRAFCEQLAAQGYRVAVCWGWLQAQALILEYLNQPKR